MEEGKIEEMKEIIRGASQLQRIGKQKKALQILREAEEKAGHVRSLIGLVCHYEGRVLQAMERYDEAVGKLGVAVELRKEENLIDYAYSIFQLFICKVYGGFPISSQDVRKTRKALWEMIDNTLDPKELGDAFQNLAYIDSYQEETKKSYLVLSDC